MLYGERGTVDDVKVIVWEEDARRVLRAVGRVREGGERSHQLAGKAGNKKPT